MFSPFSCVWLCVTPWLVAHQASLSMGFSRLEYWSGLPFPPPQDLKWGKISNVLKGKYFTKCNLGASLVVQWLRIRLVMQGTPIWSLVMEDTRRRQWHPTPVLLPGKSHGRRSLVGYSPSVGHDWATSLSLFIFMHWRRKWQPTPVFLPGESQGQGSLVGCRLWDRIESDMTEVT